MQPLLLVQDDQLAVFVGFLQHVLALLNVAVVVLQAQQGRHQGYVGLQRSRTSRERVSWGAPPFPGPSLLQTEESGCGTGKRQQATPLQGNRLWLSELYSLLYNGFSCSGVDKNFLREMLSLLTGFWINLLLQPLTSKKCPGLRRRPRGPCYHRPGLPSGSLLSPPQLVLSCISHKSRATGHSHAGSI